MVSIEPVWAALGDGLADNKLRFRAKGNLLIAKPTAQPRGHGQPTEFLGRELVNGSYVPTQEPVCIEEGSFAAKRIRKILKENPIPLWAADPMTAKACGIPWISTDYIDGEWIPSTNK